MRTEEVPDEDVLEKARGLEAVLEHLVQSPDQPKLPTQQQGQTAPLQRRTEGGMKNIKGMEESAKKRKKSKRQTGEREIGGQ